MIQPVERSVFAILCALILVSTLAATAWAKYGVVTTTDGKSFEGEISEKGDVVTIVMKGNIPVRLNRAIVDDIEYSASTKEQFEQRMVKLAKNDSDGRVELARWAIDKQEYDLAQEALESAIEINPSNEDALQLRRTVQNQRRLPKAGVTESKAPTDSGKTPPAGAEAEKPSRAEKDGPRVRQKTRLVTNDEINRIRQLELQKNENVQIRLQNDVVRRYLSSSDWEPKDFNRLSPVQKGREILDNGSSKLHADVVISTDPVALALFKSTVQRTVLPGCATTSCHGVGPTGVGADTAGDFVLHNPAEKPGEMYTNFLLMQEYPSGRGAGGKPMPKLTIGGKEYQIIDRARPENSLILQFGLPQRDADVAHPEVQNFRPTFKGKGDPKYRAIADWIGRTLAPVAPEYGIDLTSEPGSGTTRPSREASASE